MSQLVLQSDAGWLPHITGLSWARKLNSFLASPRFIGLVCLLALASNLFGAELFVYTLFVLCGIYISLFGRDLLPLMPIIIGCYIAPSAHNNPGKHAQSIFYPQNGGIYLVVLVVLLLTSIVFRLVKDRELGGKRFLTCKRRLLPGMLVLGAGYVLAGAFSGRYFENGLLNLLFALLQFLAIFLLYWFFTGTVKWGSVRKDYFAWLGLCVGLTVLMEVFGVYVSEGLIKDSTIDITGIASGWGNANNMGCLAAMMIPFACCLARQRKNGWIFSTLGVLMIVGVFFTCSRASILGALFAYAVAMIPSLKNAQRRKSLVVSNSIAAGLLLLVIVLFHEPIFTLFDSLISKSLRVDDRLTIYKEGLQVFLEHPIFGDTFYPGESSIYEWATLDTFKSLIPGRWHNTVVQLLASCGIVGLAAYGVHRIQTVKLFYEKRRTDTIYIGLSLLALLLMSLLDCHMFNVGPVLFYSMGLAFAEKCPTVKS